MTEYRVYEMAFFYARRELELAQDLFEETPDLPDCQSFLRKATLEYNQISQLMIDKGYLTETDLQLLFTL